MVSLTVSCMLQPVGPDSYEVLAAMHQKSREDRENNEAAGILPEGASGSSGGAGGGGGGGGAGAKRWRAAGG